jgi:hypothetical protein
MICTCASPLPVAPNPPEVLCLLCGGKYRTPSPEYHAAERIAIKQEITSLTVFAYVQQLEKIAKVAMDLWANLGNPSQEKLASRLYDALAEVNWMEEDDNA